MYAYEILWDNNKIIYILFTFPGFQYNDKVINFIMGVNDNSVFYSKSEIIIETLLLIKIINFTLRKINKYFGEHNTVNTFRLL